jgi:gliding motility-associated-like protein
MTCTWNFGDGFGGSGNPVSHTYTASGFYNVTLSVTNSDGCVSSLTKPAHIQVYPLPAPYFTAATTRFCEPPGIAVFTNSTTGTGPFTYLWRFGDGGTSTTTNPTHTYAGVGSYPVTLKVTDGNGCTDSATIPSFIVVGSITAAFTSPATACINTAVTFTDASSTHLSQTWDYGGLGASYGVHGSFTFTTAGTYNVRLIIFDGFCYDTVTRSITILPGPTASFTISPTHPCPPPVAITYTGTAPAGTIVTWLYGDGTSGSGMTSTHTYWRRIVDTIKMIVVDGTTGCRDTVERIDTLFDMVHWITATPTSGCKPLTVNFTASKTTYMPDTTRAQPYPYPTTSYSWNFGDGSGLSTSPSPSHTYTLEGTYTVILTSVTSNGCTVYDTVTVHVGKPPIVTFTAAPTHLCYRNNLVTFTVTVVSGPADTFMWLFGDGTSDFVSGPVTTHHYIRPGFFTATVTPYYNGCPGPPYSWSTVITIDSPQAIIRDSIYCSPPRRVQFADSSLGDDTHTWYFGDGATSTLDHPLHDYPALSVYTVTLTTHNIASGCRDTARTIIDLRRPIVDFSTADTAICRDSIALFIPTVTGGTVTSFWWHSSGRSADSTVPYYLDTFHSVGIWPITLIWADQNGCRDTLVKPNYMLVSKPDARFTVSPASGCWPLTAVFTDASTGVTGTFRTAFAWDFGDGSSTFVTTPSVTHTFTSAGVFTPTFTVTDNVGCKDTVVSPSVTVWRPTAAFSATKLNPCRWDSTRFIDASINAVNYFWMFGDGGTSTLTSPWHQYYAPGAYTVRLVVTDSHGCTDTATYINYINVIEPVASFYMDDSVSICPPLFVHFYNTSTGGVFYNWWLGDGVTSTTPNPSNLYIAPGMDTIMLVVSNTYGCRDTAYGHVNIFGYDGAFTFTPDSGCVPLNVHFYAMTLNVPSIIWDFADGNTSAVSFTDTISHRYLLPGAYVPKLILSDGSGCQASSLGDTIKVNEVKSNFQVNPVCIGDTFMLVDSSWSYWSVITSLSWDVNGITSTVDSPKFFINATGTYSAKLVATDGWGCTATVVKDITIYPLPVITACADTIVCVGDPARLTATGGVKYSWSPAATLSCATCNPAMATPTEVTVYTVVGTDVHGCSNFDSVMVSLKTHTESVARGDTEICDGAVVQLSDSGGTKYTWLPPTGLSDPHSATPLANPHYSVKYMAIAQVGNCIPDTNFVTIIVHPIPIVDAGPDQILLAGSDAQINTTGKHIYKYMWSNPESLSCDTCAHPLATMTVTTTYVVTVSSDFGCLNSDSITIHLYCDESQLFIPNAFTPNNDGENDVFYPRGNGVSIIRSFRIYNRWGELLFERSNISINDATNSWDGSFKGGGPRPDVYVYVVDALCETGEPLFIKGDVTIIR